MSAATVAAIAEWVTAAGLAGEHETVMLDGFCRRALAAGLPLARAAVIIDTLHPVHEGRAFRWSRATKGSAELVEYGPTTEGEAAASWRASPFFQLLETGGSFPAQAPLCRRAGGVSGGRGVCRRGHDRLHRAAHPLSARRRRRRDGLRLFLLDQPTEVYLGLHIGEVFYGNIGSRERLDFTVVGPAVNEVSRIAAMCRSAERDVLLSAAFAAAIGAAGPAEPVSVGRYALRGVERPQELFTLDRARG